MVVALDNQWEMMNQRLVELEEQMRKKVEILKSENAEKDKVIFESLIG